MKSEEKQSCREKNKIDKNSRNKHIIRGIINILIIIVAAYITILYVNRNGSYPWGSDVYGHLFKGEILFDSIQNGDIFLNYDFNWYNGLQPYRYWGPMPYYILASLNFITHNIFNTYNLFIMLVFIIGGSGFVLWGYYLKRQNLGLIFGLLWFFVPNNLDVIFAQGNVPYIVVTAIIPYLLLVYYKSLREKKWINYIILSFIMSFITLNHAMLTAITGISLFLFTLFYCIWNKNYGKGLLSLTFAFLGIMISAYWLLPALKGGIIGQDKETVQGTMKLITFPLVDSINPMFRFFDKERYYFGLSFAITALFGVLFSTKKERSGFIVPFIILMGTTTVAYNILSKLPMSQMFWMIRFTSLGMCMLLFSIMLWKNLRRGILFIIVCLLVIDSAISFTLVGNHIPFKEKHSDLIEIANDFAVQRVAMIDASSDGSFPSYYITFDESGNGKPQVYGWAWQGASTGSNIVGINDAWENNYFYNMFDRTLELGADVAVVKLSFIKDEKELIKVANEVGYKEVFRDEEHIVFNYKVNSTFGTIPVYKSIAIGKFAPNIPLMFPNFMVGESEYLDDYSIEELSKYETVYLSGFKYRNKSYAEGIVNTLADSGINVVVDINGIDEKGFNGIYASSVSLKNNYGEIYYQGTKINMNNFPKEYQDFRTVFISGINEDIKDNYAIAENRMLTYIYNQKDNLTYIGLNIPYYARITGDKNAIKILEDVLKEKSNTLPYREVVPIKISIDGDKKINIESERKGVLLPIAAIDAFEASIGEFSSLNNLVLMNSESLELKIGYPYLKIGIGVSILSIFLIITLLILYNKGKLIKLTGEE